HAVNGPLLASLRCERRRRGEQQSCGQDTRLQVLHSGFSSCDSRRAGTQPSRAVTTLETPHAARIVTSPGRRGSEEWFDSGAEQLLEQSREAVAGQCDARRGGGVDVVRVPGGRRRIALEVGGVGGALRNGESLPGPGGEVCGLDQRGLEVGAGGRLR